jgi:hypothetical protein
MDIVSSSDPYEFLDRFEHEDISSTADETEVLFRRFAHDYFASGSTLFLQPEQLFHIYSLEIDVDPIDRLDLQDLLMER